MLTVNRFTLLSVLLSITTTFLIHTTVTFIKFHNDIHSFNRLGLAELGLSTLESLIKNCEIEINGHVIAPNRSRIIPVSNNTCTITIKAPLNEFSALYPLNRITRTIGPVIKGKLTFKNYIIDPSDLQYLKSIDNAQMDISSVIIDLLDKHKLLESNSPVQPQWHWHPLRTIHIVIS